MADLSIDIRQLVKYHGTTLAVDHVSLEIQRGEFFSILGPSGSGKTSTLRLLAGFEFPDSGEILIEGRSMGGIPPQHRPVNMVFQSYALFPHLTVFDNIAFGLKMLRLPDAEVQARVGQVIEMVKLGRKEQRLPPTLSGGEQQRVALARALVNRPAVLLLDEPLGALDQQLRQEMQFELKAIQEQVGITFLFVTHHQEEALAMSNRLAVMDGGRVLQVGSPQEIYEAPASLFVAQFIGTSNQLSVRLESSDGVYRRATAVENPSLPAIRARMPNGVGGGNAAVIVLRPEHLDISSNAGRDGFDNALPARIEKAIYSGNETQYLLRLGDTICWKANVPNAHRDQEPFRVGETVFVRWKADDASLLTA